VLIRRRVGLEITARAVRVAVVRRLARGAWVHCYHEAGLEPGVFVPSWEQENISDEEAFRRSLRQALEAAGVRQAPVRLVLPDVTARLRILESERPPGARGPLHEYFTWRLRDDCLPAATLLAPAFYMNGHPTRGYVAMLVAAEAAIAQVQRLTRAAGADPARITSVGAALFDLLGPGPAGREAKTEAFLVVAGSSASLILTSDGAPIFARTFPSTRERALVPEAAADIARDVAATIDYCLERDTNPPDRILLAGDCAHAPGLADALAQHLGLPCHLAEPNVHLLGHGRVPPEAIGAIAAALY